MFVKICGTTSEEDALLSVAMGADAVGFVFAPSPRRVSPTRAGDIAKRLPPEVVTVGVFRDEAPARVVEVVNSIGLRAVQLHGHEAAEEARWIRARVSLLIRAFPAGSPLAAQAADYGADMVMIDALSPGSGQVFDWSLADGVPDGLPLILAGGLDAANVAEAIAAVHPWGVDVCTGVESSPGRKDASKVKDFVAAAKAAGDLPYEGADDGPYDWEEGGG